MHPWQTEIEWLTRGVRAVRIAREIGRSEMGQLIEIKGLGDAVRAAKQGIASVRAETAGLQADASQLVTALQDVRQQIQQAQSDLAFEAQTLGNGGGSAPPAPSAPSAMSAANVQSVAQQSVAHPSISPETHTRDSSGNIINR